MQLKTFIINAKSPLDGERELNSFLVSHRVLTVQKSFCQEDGGYWAVMIEYVDGEPQDSPQTRDKSRNERERELKELIETLTPEQQGRFEVYRKIRSRVAKERGVFSFIIFNNKELAEITKVFPLNQETARAIVNVNKKRLADSIHYFFTQDYDKESGQSDVEDNTD